MCILLLCERVRRCQKISVASPLENPGASYPVCVLVAFCFYIGSYFVRSVLYVPYVPRVTALGIGRAVRADHVDGEQITGGQWSARVTSHFQRPVLTECRFVPLVFSRFSIRATFQCSSLPVNDHWDPGLCERGNAAVLLLVSILLHSPLHPLDLFTITTGSE